MKLKANDGLSTLAQQWLRLCLPEQAKAAAIALEKALCLQAITGGTKLTLKLSTLRSNRCK